MVRKVLLFSWLVFFTFSANCQVKLGFRSGITISTITNSSFGIRKNKMAVGPGGGLVIHARLTDVFAFQPELLFNARGVSAKLSVNGFSERGTLRLYYLDIPLILRAYFGNDKFNVFVGAGPQFDLGLFVQNVIRYSGKHFSQRTTETSAFSSETRRFEIAWDFDVGIRKDIGKGDEIELAFRPVIGLINITKEEFKEQDNRNFMLLISVAYLFGK